MTLQSIGENSHLFIFPQETFNGDEFYNKHIDAHFLRDKKNLEKILCDGWRLRAEVENLPSGHTITIDGMFLDSDSVPLVVRNSKLSDESDVPNDMFTPRRLAGMVAAVAYHQQVVPLIPEAKALGLSWDIDIQDKKLYFSAVPGAELFVSLFKEYPFVCALKRFESKLISEEYLRYIANIPDDTGYTMAERFREKYLDNHSDLLDDLERRFKREPFDIKKVLSSVTLGIKML